MGANLTFVVPVFALTILAFGVLLIERRTTFKNAFAYFSLTPVLLLTVLAGPVLIHARKEDFYVGETSFLHTIQSLVDNSLYCQGIKLHLGRISTDYIFVFFDHIGIATVILPIFFLIVALAFLAAFFRWARARDFRAQTPAVQGLFCFGGTLTVSVFLLWGIHILRGVLYPTQRTGLYLIPLLALSLFCFFELRFARPWSLLQRAAAIAVGVFGFLFIFEYALEFRTESYNLWTFDASTRSLLQRLAAQPRPADGKVRLGVSWEFEQSVNFYRIRDHLTWLQPVRREDIAPGFDYYLVLPRDHDAVHRFGATDLYRDQLSTALIARR